MASQRLSAVKETDAIIAGDKPRKTRYTLRATTCCTGMTLGIESTEPLAFKAGDADAESRRVTVAEVDALLGAVGANANDQR